ncbi:MAG: rhamnulose-1-phosphate aldolase [Eggerthellales bacterium]|nr:rhamnulose-1-phosphate aldolase [Eggerthellales bacterium]
MGFFDEALDKSVDMWDKGVLAAKGAVSGVAVEQQPFMREFARLCRTGWERGWNEANGGNLSYRLTNEEVDQVRGYFYSDVSPWVPLGVRAGNMARQFLVVTASGSFLGNVASHTEENVGIVEINDTGDAWRLVWGLKGGGRPTSELPSHFMNHSVRMQATGGAMRVLYHAHPSHIIAMTKLLPNDAGVLNRALWSMTTECVLVFPEGLGLVPTLTPGSMNLAQATCEWMTSCCGCVWANHGLFASGDSFDSAFGLMETVDKAAEIYLVARAANGGSDEFPSNPTIQQLQRVAEDLHLVLNPRFLQ